MLALQSERRCAPATARQVARSEIVFTLTLTLSRNGRGDKNEDVALRLRSRQISHFVKGEARSKQRLRTQGDLSEERKETKENPPAAVLAL